MNLMRRIRAMLTTAIVWGIAWTVPGTVWIGILAVLQRNSPRQMGLFDVVTTILLNWTAVGAISGAVFALTLSIAERRKSSLDGLSMRRVATWGAIGGVVLPAVLIPFNPAGIPNPLQQLALSATAYGVLGAASAAMSLRLARGPFNHTVLKSP